MVVIFRRPDFRRLPGIRGPFSVLLQCKTISKGLRKQVTSRNSSSFASLLLPALGLICFVPINPINNRSAVTIQPTFLLEQGVSAVSTIWEREIPDETEYLEVISDKIVIRVGSAVIEGYDTVTGELKWGMRRDGATAVHFHKIENSPNLLVLSRFNRPTPESGMIEGNSYRLSLLQQEEGTLLWDTGAVLGDCLNVEAIPDSDRALLLVRGDDGSGKLFVLVLSDGSNVWDIDFRELEEVPSGESLQVQKYYTVGDGRLFRIDRRERVISVAAHDLMDGNLRWVGYLRDETEDVVINRFGRALYITGRNLSCMDPASGVIRWHMENGWLPLIEQEPWLLLHLPGKDRLQLVQSETGQEQWRSEPSVAINATSSISWNPNGILTGESRGVTTLLNRVDGKRISRGKPQYPASSRRTREEVFTLSEGLLFLQVGSKRSTVLRVDGRGVVRWEVELSPPAVPDEILRGEAGRGRLYTVPGEGAGVLWAGSIWVVSSKDGEAVLERVDLGSGKSGGIVNVLATRPVFAASDMNRHVYYVSRNGKLVAGEY